MSAVEQIVRMFPDNERNGVDFKTAPHGLVCPVTMTFQLPTSIYGAMLVIWHLRPLLQRRFPLHKGKPEDFVRFLAWCAVEGRRQYKILRSIPEWDAQLSQAVELPHLKGDKWPDGFSVAMFFYGISRYRYFLGPILNNRMARHRVARAYWRGERHKLMFPQVMSWQLAWVKDRFKNMDTMIKVLSIASTDAQKSVQQLVEDFQFDDVVQYFSEELSVDTCLSHHSPYLCGDTHLVMPENKIHVCRDLPYLISNKGLPLPLSIKLFKKLAKAKESFVSRPSQFQLASITNRVSTGRQPVTQSDYQFGVNLFGYAQGEIGIGEDVRLVALALQSQQIPFCIINVKPGDNVSQKDDSVNHWLVDAPRYSINIFCTTGIEQVRYGCEQGLSVFEGRYNIGFWPWELPDWPASCQHVFSMVDEIWGISRYTAHAYRASQRTVVPMTLPVTVERVASLGRNHFGLPQDAYLFVFSFDFNSTLIRKNPEAVVQAFQSAFPNKSNANVGLVIKASHIDPDNEVWQRIQSAMSADSRINVIGQTLRRPEVLALYSCCDCFVSLHRAEGFGRGLAEALLLDMQLITTDFSGNLDFCDNKRVGLVRQRPISVKKGEYFHADGQYWADPDVEHAAELMQKIYKNPKETTENGNSFSPETVGIKYAQRLDEINRIINKKLRKA